MSFNVEHVENRVQDVDIHRVLEKKEHRTGRYKGTRRRSAAVKKYNNHIFEGRYLDIRTAVKCFELSAA